MLGHSAREDFRPESPVPLAIVDVEVVLIDPALFQFQMPAVFPSPENSAAFQETRLISHAAIPAAGKDNRKTRDQHSELPQPRLFGLSSG